MKARYRVVLVDDHAIIRDGLRSLLSSESNFEVVGEAGEGSSGLRLAENLRPDLVITDLSMPQMDGFNLIAALKERNPEMKFIALTIHRNDEYVFAALRAGADGYVLKDANYAELIQAAKAVLKGGRYLSPEISESLIQGCLDGKETSRQKIRWETLSGREREIMALIADGKTNSQIARRLCISLNAVENHRDKIMKKLKVHNAAALVTVAMERGLIGR